jgi:hypothetical protein
LFLPDGWNVASHHDWDRRERTNLLWNGINAAFQTVSHRWAAPHQQPILEAERYKAGQLQISGIPMDMGAVHHIGYELRTPKMLTKLACLLLIIDNGTARVEARPHTLERI